jgi:hypothetical protein
VADNISVPHGELQLEHSQFFRFNENPPEVTSSGDSETLFAHLIASKSTLGNPASGSDVGYEQACIDKRSRRSGRAMLLKAIDMAFPLSDDLSKIAWEILANVKLSGFNPVCFDTTARARIWSKPVSDQDLSSLGEIMAVSSNAVAVRTELTFTDDFRDNGHLTYPGAALEQMLQACKVVAFFMNSVLVPTEIEKSFICFA